MNFGLMDYELCMPEMAKSRNPSFWKTKIMSCLVKKTGKNLEGSRESVLNKKCFLLCLVYAQKISEFLEKYRYRFMLENYNLSRNFRKRFKSILAQIMHRLIALH